MSTNLIEHRRNRSSDTTRLMSPAIWSDCPWADILDPRSRINGFAFYDNFQNLPLQGTLTTQIGAGQYKVFGDTGNTITKAITNTGGAANATQYVPGGFLQLAIDTDNDEVAIAQAYPSALMTNSTASSGKLWFEACYMQNGGVATGTGSVQSDAIPTNCASVFLGLANVAGITLSTTVPLNDGDPISNTMYGIGFRIAEDGLGVVDTVVTDGATSFTNIGASEAGTLTAWNPKKFGLVYDPAADAARRVVLYADNQELTTKYPSATLAALTNLNANGLGMLLAATADSAGATFKGCLKWWAIAQVLP